MSYWKKNISGGISQRPHFVVYMLTWACSIIKKGFIWEFESPFPPPSLPTPASWWRCNKLVYLSYFIFLPLSGPFLCLSYIFNFHYPVSQTLTLPPLSLTVSLVYLCHIETCFIFIILPFGFDFPQDLPYCWNIATAMIQREKRQGTNCPNLNSWFSYSLTENERHSGDGLFSALLQSILGCEFQMVQ